MTENEAIERLQTLNIILTDKAGHEEDGIEKIFTFSDITAICTAIQALEEIQQYRAIGLTPKMVKEMIESEKLASHAAIIRGAELELYQAIGTIEEFKALKEKRTAKSRRISAGKYFCPECGRIADRGHCKTCGQNLY